MLGPIFLLSLESADATVNQPAFLPITSTIVFVLIPNYITKSLSLLYNDNFNYLHLTFLSKPLANIAI